MICSHLHQHGIAKVKLGPILTWVTSTAIDDRIGGANVLKNIRFTMIDPGAPRARDQFEKAVKRVLRLELASTQETVEAFFQLYHAENFRISRVDADGNIFWELVDG